MLRPQEPTRPGSRNRIGVAGLRQRHLVEERLDLCPLQDRQSVGDGEIGDHHVRKSHLKWQQALVVRDEPEGEHRHGARLRRLGGQLGFLGQGGLGGGLQLVPNDEQEAILQIVLEGTPVAHIEVRSVSLSGSGPVLQRLVGQAEIEIGRPGFGAHLDGVGQRRARLLEATVLVEGYAQTGLGGKVTRILRELLLETGDLGGIGVEALSRTAVQQQREDE